jgi:hypothetical protein
MHLFHPVVLQFELVILFLLGRFFPEVVHEYTV